ncbi:tetratricopeptide repeat protein [Pseudoteredinibacter isoporae]|uniref:Tetratricopeptide (TPR) repeat protein n=1 Tax=Pseudoteredinibacter isoporae TaxID=570281 RepID=A0A7X0JVS8_9GAMM|nr:hypothetical protein [Pseudoteredinibacter isoporae]MBB6522186.1 tetratricopeptide (TPR) repeat protein [Pseudoteredinibacter isoporae]NHO87720.1 hypothetical protein [Pseudoteredinibacter isoporae]NIB23949.1 hypothetical protein [Pseudoteredinibacter isoporae]
MEKLDIIIALLVVILTSGLAKFIATAFYRRMSGDTHTRIVNVWISRGEYEMALSEVNKFLQKRPADSHLLWLRAIVYFKQNEWKKARSEFESLITNEPLYGEDALKYVEAIDKQAGESAHINSKEN